MTNAKENQLEINKAVSTLKTKLKKLRSNATEWHNTQFKSANDSLYAMFAELYTLYEQCKNSTQTVSTKRFKRHTACLLV